MPPLCPYTCNKYSMEANAGIVFSNVFFCSLHRFVLKSVGLLKNRQALQSTVSFASQAPLHKLIPCPWLTGCVRSTNGRPRVR